MKKNEMPFNMDKKVRVPNAFWYQVELLLARFYSGRFGAKTKIVKHNCEHLKPPYLVLSNHGSFVDFPNNVLAMHPTKTCWVASIEEFIGREWLFDQIGVIPKRKFTSDMPLIKKIIDALKNQNICVSIYPEARFSLAGINEDIGTSIGKLVKICKVPVVVISQKGNFLRSPQWCKRPYKDITVRCDFTQVITKEEAEMLSADEIQKKIEEAFVYDDYQYQLDNKIRIKSKFRAQNIHKILYRCPVCQSEHHMDSEGIHLWCNHCHSKWEMDEFSQLHCLNHEQTFQHVPDWYLYEKECTKQEVMEHRYRVEEQVRVEKLINAQTGFKKVGIVNMIHDENGYHFEGMLDDQSDFSFTKHPKTTRSVHIEYDYKGRGDALDIVYLDETYFVFPLLNKSNLTKYHFATEAIFAMHDEKKQ